MLLLQETGDEYIHSRKNAKKSTIMLMLEILFCLLGIFTILVISEILGQQKILRGEAQRKFVHILSGIFIATWPWLISLKTIAWLGAAMLAVVLLNHKYKLLDFHSHREKHSYGDVFFALGVILSAVITDEKSFFAVAILTMAVADGAANLIGSRSDTRWQYKVFGHKKTVIGSMAMWLVSLFVLAASITLLADGLINYKSYLILLIFLPPVLTLAENIVVNGYDNLVIPIIVIFALNLAK